MPMLFKSTQSGYDLAKSVALDCNQVYRALIYDGLGYFVLAAHGINGKKAAFGC